MKFYVVVLIFAFYETSADMSQESAGGQVIDIGASYWDNARQRNTRLLLLFYKEKGCELCPQAVENFEQIFGQPELPSDVYLCKSTDKALMSIVGVHSVPAVVYLREGTHVIYDGDVELEPLLAWIGPASHVAVKHLNDDSFEHLTQASSGATTGDWLVVYYRSSCESILSSLETVGVRIQGKVNVAKVDLDESPLLMERFRIKRCPQVIYFRHGKMYRYDLPKTDTATLASFVDGFYKNSKAERIPVPKSQFDFVTENIADYLKLHLQGENRSLALSVVCCTAVVLAVVLFCCCQSLLRGPPKQKTH